MNKRYTQAELMQDAQIKGATHYRIYYTNTHLGIYRKEPEPFSYHFFNSSDEEICYFVCDMLSLCGMYLFDTPRVWSNAFKLNSNYSEPISFNTLVCQQFSKDNVRKLSLM